MKREDAIAIIKCHEAELKELGVLSLALFGSTARDEASADSDVDVAVTLKPGTRGFAHLDRVDQLKEVLATILGRPVDVIDEPAASPRIQLEIDQDRVNAF